MKTKYDYGYLPLLILDSLTARVSRGLQTDLNTQYNRQHRINPAMSFCGSKAWITIVLPDGTPKYFRITVKEVRKY